MKGQCNKTLKLWGAHAADVAFGQRHYAMSRLYNDDLFKEKGAIDARASDVGVRSSSKVSKMGTMNTPDEAMARKIALHHVTSS